MIYINKEIFAVIKSFITWKLVMLEMLFYFQTSLGRVSITAK